MAPSGTVVLLISLFVSLIGSILIWCLVLPEHKRPSLNKFFLWIADVFNFKSLLIEKILKFTYLLLTLASIVFGFCMLFIVSYGERMAIYGVLVMILGPICLRLAYELLMMAVLTVKNIIDINNKLPLSGDKKDEYVRPTNEE